MPTRLARWVCVLTALAAGSTFAADKPKEKKGKPANPPATGGIASGVGAVIGQATGNPKTGAVVGGLLGAGTGVLLGPDAAAQAPTEKFIISKPVGMWARDVNVGEAVGRFTLEITDNRLILKIDVVHGKQTANGRVSVDYSINKESTLFGVIDSCELKSSEKVEPEKLGQFAKFSGQPFAVRFRVEDDGLTFKDFKGLGVGLGEKAPEDITNILTMLNGRYTKVDPSKPLPELKATESTESRLDRVPLPTPHYLKHYPTYIAPDPAFPLQRERDELLDPTGEVRRCGTAAAATTPTTSAYAGPISGAVPTPSRSDATVIPAKSEAPAAEPPRLIPRLREDDCPKCDDPPSDAEVMQRFNARQQNEASFEVAHDDIVIVKNLVSDKVDAPRFYPLVGLARTHCCQWECGVYYRDLKAGKPKVEVISFETNTMRMMVPVGDSKIPQRMLEK